MSFMADQMNRLLRTKWTDPDELAKEIAAIFRSDVPIQINGQIEVSKQDGRSTFKIVDRLDSSSTDALVSLESNDKTKDLTFDDFGLLEGAGTNNGVGSDLSKTIQTNQQPGQIPGIIVSGTGVNYQVDLYRQGYPGPSTRAAVTQLQIDPTDTIPAGTFVMVSQVGAKFVMLAPVWL